MHPILHPPPHNMKHLNDNKDTSVVSTRASIRTYRTLVFPGVPFQPTAHSDFSFEWELA